jgi:hypothetical protein
MPPPEEAGPASTPGWEMRSVTMVGHGSATRLRALSRGMHTMLRIMTVVFLLGASALGLRYFLRWDSDRRMRNEAARLRAKADEAGERAKMLRNSLMALTLAVDPPSARVTIDGAPVSGFEMSIARDGMRHVLHAEADGYAAEDRPFFASTDQKLELHLKKKRPGRPKNVGPTNADGVDAQQMKTLEKLLNKLGEETTSF